MSAEPRLIRTAGHALAGAGEKLMREENEQTSIDIRRVKLSAPLVVTLMIFTVVNTGAVYAAYNSLKSDLRNTATVVEQHGRDIEDGKKKTNDVRELLEKVDKSVGILLDRSDPHRSVTPAK